MNISSGGSESTNSEPAHLATLTFSIVIDLHWPLQIIVSAGPLHWDRANIINWGSRLVTTTSVDPQSVYDCSLFQISEPSFPEIIQSFLSCWISSSTCDSSKVRPTDRWQVMSGNVRHYRSLLSDNYGYLTSVVSVALRQNLLELSTSATVHLTVKITLIRTQYTEQPQTE